MSSNYTDEDPILTTSAAARMLGVATSTVQLWMESGAIESWKTPGGHRRTRESLIRALMNKVGGHEAGAAGRRVPPNPNDPEYIPDRSAPYPMAADLLTAKRQWFKARVGLAPQQTPREWAFCSHAILQDKPFVVEDAASDERFSGNPLVLADPHIRFYAGVPLRDEGGNAMGTLCVIDREPRKLRSGELQALLDLAAIAAAEIGREGK
jgi:excisionase family DNA binding protein